MGTQAATVTAETATAVANPSGMELDLPVDPNEPTYCFCNQVSYGEMVACDNPDVCYLVLRICFLSYILFMLLMF